MMKFNPQNLENIILKQNYYKSKKKIINRRNSI